MVDQIADLRTAGIPADIVLYRHEIEGYRDDAADSAEQAAGMLEEQRSENAAADLRMTGLLREAQEAAAEATSWVNAGAGVSIGAEEPAVKRNGHVWLVESSMLRTPLYPGSTVFPGLAVFPERVGSESDGSHVIVGIRRWDAGSDGSGGVWTAFTLAQSLVDGSASRAQLTALDARLTAMETNQQ